MFQEFQANWAAPPKVYSGGGSEVGPLQSLSPEKPKIIDASHIIKPPHRATRPDHIVIILRGLPGITFFAYNILLICVSHNFISIYCIMFILQT